MTAFLAFAVEGWKEDNPEIGFHANIREPLDGSPSK